MLPEHLIAYFFQILLFVIVNTDKDDSVFGQKIPRQQQAGKNHRAPVRMKSAAAVRIFKQFLLIFSPNSRALLVFFCRAFKIIPVNKIRACIIRRININHLHLAQIAFPQKL